MKKFILLLIFSVCLSPASALAISNGGFETGDFTNWQTLGLVSVETAAFGSGPPEGTFQAFLDAENGTSMATASIGAIETFLGVPGGFVDSIGGMFFIPMDGSALKQDFTASAGEVLNFQWNFLTNDGIFAAGVDPDASRDASFVTLTGPGLLFGGQLSDTLDSPTVTNNVGFSMNPFLVSSTPFTLETGFRNFSFVVPNDGNYTVGFSVVNSGFTGLSSGLLVDQVSSSQQPIPEPSTMLLFGSGMVGLAAWRWRKTKQL